ncbi:MAG TPA: aspartate--tRNA ligase [Candidatus Nanoarchaeia archaeon]|nr:aspartate--tRNA ligase [Candidatus Nanoarchaeia archaeon]
MLRTHTCGELRGSHIGKKVHLCGWVQTVRAHGGVVFLDIRDRYGITQVVIIKKMKEFEKASSLALESSIRVSGEVVARKAGTENKDLPTGHVELLCHELEIYNICPPLPFTLNDASVNEDVRLKYRYLDLRSKRLQDNLILRHKVYKAIHSAMDKEGFLSVDTPILYKSTPEGARDYLVPSRVHAGKFYALPQSPQLFKQLLMMAGYDKYYQLARCFRDEDLRADRQPEFTQLDVEMAFIDREDIIETMEKVVASVFKEVLHVELKIPFPRMSYDEAMKKHNSDKPDIRKKDEKFAFLWVLDFPMFEYREEDKRWYAMHHPFTSPMPRSNFAKPESVKAKAYDLVLNGVEIAGGSIRIHDSETQNKVFNVLGINEKEAQQKFGFLLEALSHGAPPHGGIAFGLDRLLQIMTGSSSIREVIAFPKNQAAQDVMLDTPSEVSAAQLKEVHIKVDVKEEKKKK